MERDMKRLWMTAVLAACALGAAPAPAQAAEVKVTGVTGEAFLAGKDGIARLKPGMTCGSGDMVMTRKGGQLEIVIDGKAGCRLLSETTAAIGGAAPGRMGLLVAEGEVVLNVKKLPADSEWVLDTPTSVASVRGTQFWGRVAGGQTGAESTFAVKEGSVQVMSKETGSVVDLNAGQAVDLTPASQELQVRAAFPAEMAAMKAADDIASRM
jgi:ferric-dicitrate binding protein FerR (iron transport regulator)